MKICFVGLGSIGQRHLRNLYSIFCERSIKAQFDALRHGHAQLPADIKNLLHHEYFCIDKLDSDYDIIFVTNPTSEHYNTIRDVCIKTKHLFIEKPVFHDLSVTWEALPFSKEGTQYVACPLRYNPVISYLHEYLKNSQVVAARVICSSYLPEWRPDIDYRNCYSAHKEQGGGVRIDLIHEIDYISYLFGMPQNVHSFSGQYSSLQISSEDLALYILSYKDKLISLHLDYFGRTTKRQIEIYTNEETIVGDLIKGTISFEKSGEFIGFSNERDAYQMRELESFLDMILYKKENENPILRAIQTLCIAIGG